MAPTLSSSHTRRNFLLAIGAVPVLGGLPSTPPDDADDMAAMGRLSGLEFTAEHRKMAEAKLRRHRGNYEAVRERSLPFELSPSASFDPWPVGTTRPAPTGPVPFAIRDDVVMPATDADLAFATIDELASLLRQKKVTCTQLTELSLERLTEYDPRLLCVVSLLRDSALAHAAVLDAELAAGKDRGPLHGIPYGAKDLFGWPGTITTFGTASYVNHEWDVRATVLERLRAAGAVLVAKLSLGALAMGDLWHGGRTRNPYDPERGSSGSSAGPASAVAAGLVTFAIGTETLGSIVSPCRQCGIAGLRPTFGSISRYGAMPLSWTMDKIGPIARSAICAALVFDCLRGRDGHDPAARDTAFPWRRGRGLEGLRIGIIDENRFPRRDDESAFRQWLEGKGVTVQKVKLPAAPYRSMLTMLDAEAATAFDEFTRQGLTEELPGQGARDWGNTFRAARTIPAVEYLQASRARMQLLSEMQQSLGEIDVFMAPTGGNSLVATNLTGHPTYVLPVGAQQDQGGRPTVLALIGRLDGEAAVLAVAEAWQAETRWHLARPELTR